MHSYLVIYNLTYVFKNITVQSSCYMEFNGWTTNLIPLTDNFNKFPQPSYISGMILLEMNMMKIMMVTFDFSLQTNLQCELTLNFKQIIIIIKTNKKQEKTTHTYKPLSPNKYLLIICFCFLILQDFEQWTNKNKQIKI